MSYVESDLEYKSTAEKVLGFSGLIEIVTIL